MMPERNSVSKEINEIETWIAGHESTCEERYKGIREDLAECRVDIKAALALHRESMEKLTRQLTAIKKGLRQEMKNQDAAIEVRVGKLEQSNQDSKVRTAYILGAAGACSFIGGILGPVISTVVMKLFQ